MIIPIMFSAITTATEISTFIDHHNITLQREFVFSFKILSEKSPVKMGPFCKRLLVVELVFIFHTVLLP